VSTLWKEDDFDRVLPCGSDESNSEFMVDPEGVGAIYRVIRFFRMRTSDDGERRCKVVCLKLSRLARSHCRRPRYGCCTTCRVS
jgi:hypothetical protein